MTTKRALDNNSISFSGNVLDEPLLKRRTTDVQPTPRVIPVGVLSSDSGGNGEPDDAYFTSVIIDDDIPSTSGCKSQGTNHSNYQVICIPPALPECISITQPELVTFESASQTPLNSAILTNCASSMEAKLHEVEQCQTGFHNIPLHQNASSSLEGVQGMGTEKKVTSQCMIDLTGSTLSNSNTLNSLETMQPMLHIPSRDLNEEDHSHLSGTSHEPSLDMKCEGYQDIITTLDSDSYSSDSDPDISSVGGMTKVEQVSSHHLDLSQSISTDSGIGHLPANCLATRRGMSAAPSKTSMCNQKVCCSLELLIILPFNQGAWSDLKRMDLVKCGPPKPLIEPQNLTKNLYEQFPWLAACQKLNLIFCWPCILFAKRQDSWQKGFKLPGVKTIYRRCLSHEKLDIHTDATNTLRKWEELITSPNVNDLEMKDEKLSYVSPSVIIDLSQDQDKDLECSEDFKHTSIPGKSSSEISKLIVKEKNASDTSKKIAIVAPQNTVAINKICREIEPEFLPLNPPISKQPNANILSPGKCVEGVLIPNSSLLITKLQENHFVHGKWSNAQQRAIIEGGRPRPSIEKMIEKRFGPSAAPEAVHYCQSYYHKFPWLAGSLELSKLFCWPCLLFAESHGVWTHEGILNIRVDISWSAEQHALTQEHMASVLSLKRYQQFSKKVIKQDHSVALCPIKSNFTVKQKRELLTYVIDVICFLKKAAKDSEPTLCADIVDMIGLIAYHDHNLKVLNDKYPHAVVAEVATYSNNISSIIDSTLSSKILEELKEVSFVSVILKSVCAWTKLAVIVRFVSREQKVTERFIQFIEAENAQMLLDQISGIIEDNDWGVQLMGFAYDGAVLKPDDIQTFNYQMQEKYNTALFFHYPEFNFVTLIQQSLSKCPDCIQFFERLKQLTRFFLQIQFSHDENLWGIEDKLTDILSGCVEAVWLNFFLITSFLQRVIAEPSLWKTDTVLKEAVSVLKVLSSLETRFLLALISKIISTLDQMAKAFSGPLYVEKWRDIVETTLSAFSRLKVNGFDKIFTKAANAGPSYSTLRGELDISSEKAKLLSVHDKVLDWSITFIQNWTINLELWAYFHADTNNEQPYGNDVTAMKKIFRVLDTEKLFPQIKFIRSNSYFRKKSTVELLNAIVDIDMTSALSELHKFLLLVLTSPMTQYPLVHETAAKRLTTYADRKWNITNDSTRAYVEGDILSSLQKEPNFHVSIMDQLIEKFGRKELALVPCSYRTT